MRPLTHTLFAALLASIPATAARPAQPDAPSDAAAHEHQPRASVAAAWREFHRGHWPGAAAAARGILARSPADGPARHALRGECLRLLAECHQAEPIAAIEAYDAALAGGLRDADVLAGKGLSLRQLAREAEAIACFDESLAIAPDDADTLRARGLALMALHENDKAMADLARAVRLAPGDCRQRIALAGLQRRIGDVAAAKATLAEAVAIAAAAGDDCRRGEALAELRQWAAAIEAQSAALRSDPANLEALALRSAAHAKRHDSSAALADARDLAAKDPGNPAHAIRIATILSETAHDGDAAIVVLDAALAIAPRNVGLLLARGRLRSQRNDHVAAVADCDAAAAANPGTPGVDEARASLHVRQREFALAVAAYDRLLALVPKNPFTLCERAAARRSLGDERSALADCDAALALLPPQDHAGRVRIHRQAKRWPEALAACTAAIAADPDDARLLHDRAWIHNEMENYRRALDDCRAGLAIDPDDEDLQEELAYASKGLGDLDAAVAAFTRLLDRHAKGDAGLLFYRGQALMAKHDHAAARADFARARDIEPGNPNYRDWLGAAHRENGDFADALACFDDAIRLDPYRAPFHRHRGSLLLQLSRHTEAVMSYDEAIRLEPAHADAFYGRGLCREKLGHLFLAEADFAEAVRLAPHDADNREALDRVRAALATWHVASLGTRPARGA